MTNPGPNPSPNPNPIPNQVDKPPAPTDLDLAGLPPGMCRRYQQGKCHKGAQHADLTLALTLTLTTAPYPIPTPSQATRPRVAFLEWTDPLFVGGHWVPG